MRGLCLSTRKTGIFFMLLACLLPFVHLSKDLCFSEILTNGLKGKGNAVGSNFLVLDFLSAA